MDLDPFENSKFSVAWAKDHITELDREIDKFFSDENGHTAFVEPDGAGTGHAHTACGLVSTIWKFCQTP